MLSKKEPELDNLENSHPVAKNGNGMLRKEFEVVAGQTFAGAIRHVTQGSDYPS